MRDSNLKYLFLLPGISSIVLITIVPIVSVINLSFQRWQVALSPVPGPYIGFENYIRAFGDADFWNAIWITLIYTLLTVTFSIAIGVFIAVILQKDTGLNNAVKGLLIFPFSISLALRGYSFRFMLAEGSGVFDTILDFFLPPFQNVLWLGNATTALFWLTVPVFWAWGPLSGLMILGALNNISTEIFDAAKVDGAGNFRVFTSITLPLLRPMITVVALLITLFAVRMFDLVQTMTGGGPGRSTETLNYFIYRVGFQFFDFGYAAALAIILTLILIVLSYAYSRLLMD